MKRTAFAMGILCVAATVAGCGAVAAPPVDIPAPVVGRISAGTPDASGKSTITGTEGAVTPDTIVLATNEETSVSLMWRITDAIIPTAYAQSTPAICSESGKACAVADSTGAFTLTIDAAVGNTISIVIIDETGKEISEKVQIVIPSSTLTSLMNGCVGESTTGRLVDMANFGGLPIMLFEGAGEQNNLLVFGSDSSAAAVEIPGCYASGLAIYATVTGELVVTAISGLDQVLWSAIFDSSGLIGILEHVLDREPLAITFDDDPIAPLIAMKSSGTYSVDRISLVDGLSEGTFTVPPPIVSGEMLTGVMGLHTVGPFADGGWLGALVTTGTDGSNGQSYVVFFDAQALTNLSLDGENKRFGEEVTGNSIFFETAHDIADVGLGIDKALSSQNVVMFVADHGNQAAHVVALLSDIDPVSLVNHTLADLALYKISTTYDSAYDRFTSLPPLSPRRVALGNDGDIPVAYLISDELYLWKIRNYPEDMSVTQDTYDLSSLGLTDPAAIALDDLSMSLMVGDNATGAAVDISSYWGNGGL